MSYRKNASEDNERQLRFEEFYHSVNEDIEETEFVGGWFARKHVSILASKAGIGKTWYVVKLLADLSVGGTIMLSQAYYHPPVKSLYFVGETNLSLILERFALLRENYNRDNIVIVTYMDLARKKMFADLDTQDGGILVNDIIREVNPDIVVFDSLMSFRRDDESNSQSTKDMLVRMQFAAANNNVAVLATHHLRKQDRRMKEQRIDQDEIIGSSSLVRMAASAFIMTSNYNKINTIRCVKSWWQYPPSITYQMKNKEGQLYFELTDEENDITKKRLRAERYIKEQFANGGHITTQMIMDECKVSKNTALSAISDIPHEIFRTPDNRTFFIGI